MGAVARSEFEINVPAPNTPYFTPIQFPSSGTALKIDENTPTIFTPLKIRDVEFQNRICKALLQRYHYVTISKH